MKRYSSTWRNFGIATALFVVGGCAADDSSNAPGGPTAAGDSAAQGTGGASSKGHGSGGATNPGGVVGAGGAAGATASKGAGGAKNTGGSGGASGSNEGGAPATDGTSAAGAATAGGDGAPANGGPCADSTSTTLDGVSDASHPSGQAPPNCTPVGYTTTYVDDFDGTSLASGWTTPSGFQYNASWVSSQNVQAHDGMMDISMTYSGNAGEEAVVGWAQLTNDPAAELEYGKFLVRQRADVFSNVAIATLLWPVAQNVWPPEVDFVEDDVGDRHWYAYNHYQDSKTQTVEDAQLTNDGWHTWGVEWAPESVTYTRDGVVWATETDPAVIPTIKMYLGFVMACFQQPQPESAHWQIDWIAIYGKQ